MTKMFTLQYKATTGRLVLNGNLMFLTGFIPGCLDQVAFTILMRLSGDFEYSTNNHKKFLHNKLTVLPFDRDFEVLGQIEIPDK